MVAHEKCFILLCTNDTEKECLERNLFGDVEWRIQYLTEIRAGEIGFMINLSKDELIGIFEARSEGQLNIEPDAWGGRFPAQVRVQPMSKIQRIPNAISVLAKIGIKMKKLRSGAQVPQFPVHGQEVAQKILSHFREPVPKEKKHPPRGDIIPIAPGKQTFGDVIGLDDVKGFIQKGWLIRL